ncbi:MAG: chitobiase/beta-hexosaminidase C-terminal domain-containing protein, partial [Muribaculaceae bacterium]|nr:chitobiase/beta-hexosaminidase C-terminal domain-containing protein [Muribaculaceae bacterium]
MTKTYQLCTDQTQILNPDNQFVIISARSMTVNKVKSFYAAKTTATTNGVKVLEGTEVAQTIDLDIENLGLGLFSIKPNGDKYALYENVAGKYWGLPDTNGVTQNADLPAGNNTFELSVAFNTDGSLKIKSSATEDTRTLMFSGGTNFKNYKDASYSAAYAYPLFYKEVVETSVDPVDISYKIEGVEGVVTLSCATEGATIYYGTSEDKMTNVYSAPFKVTENCTIYAYADKNGEKSITKNCEVVLPYTSFKKVIENTSGADQITVVGDFQVIYVNGDKRRLILTDGTSNLLIYKQNTEYSIDYAVGTKISKVEGSVASYNNCFRLIDADLTEGGNGCAYSPVELTSLSGLTYEDNIFDEVVIKNCIISGKDSGSPLIELGDESIALYDLFDEGYENAVGADITGFVWRFKDVLEIVPIEITGGEAVATVERPTFTPTDRELKLNDVVTIKCATEGATIYYTLDGTDPDDSSTKYTAPIPFTESCTIKARAYYEGEDKTMLPSPVASREYHVFDPTINVISEGNHNADENNSLNQYIKHNCTVDGVEYHMNAAHVGDGGTNGTNNTLMLNSGNKNAKFCYLIQVSENEGYVLDGIEVAYNTNNNKVNFAVRAANTPFDDSDSNMESVKTAITKHGVAVGTITESSPALSSEDFAKEYKYFAIYPLVDKAVYLDNFTIRYREAGPLTAPQLLGLEDLDEENVFYDDDEGEYLVMASEPLMVDFDIDLEDNPGVEIYYALMPM